MLGRRYRVVRVEGTGGYGTIYEARDTRFQSERVVAVKEMSDVYLDVQEKTWALQSFRQEAELLAQLKHSNMPGVFDFFEENGKAYLVMEFIKGSTMERELEMAGGPLDEALVMRWALQLCDVLNYLHTRQPPISNRGPGSVIDRSAANTISVPFTCSTEKVDWMTTAVHPFHQSNATVGGKTIQIELDLRGSLDAQQKILNGTIQPIIWSPASFLELNQLITAWEQAHAGKDIVILSGDLQPKQLVFSPLVFAAWRDRSEILLKYYTSIDWPSIHDASKLSNWANIGGQSTWGPVKFGHTRPDKSNSGLLAITLLAYSFFKEQRELTVQQIDNPQFLSYFSDIEGAVSAFGRSSGTFLTNVVIPLGPPEFDIIATYENLLLTNNKTAMAVQHQPLQLFYPSLNIVSDHPFAILQGNWVTHEQQMAARIFRDFLLAAPQQRLALATGFRPANVNVHITDNAPGNVFLQQSSYDITPKLAIEPLAQVPTSTVINELIKQWKIKYDGSPTTLG